MAKKTGTSKPKRNLSSETSKTEGDMLLVIASSELTVARGGATVALDTGRLETNVKDFLGKLGRILGSAPAAIGGFELSEFEVAAEISAEGTLGILGTGVKAAGKGGLTFKFKRVGGG